MLLQHVGLALDALGLADRHTMVAVSGGVDSMVLLDLLAELRATYRLELSVAHVNHGLRGPESDADEELVAERADQLGLPFFASRVEPASLREGVASRERPTLQEAARRLRRDALLLLANEQGAEHIATAHHADDQLETVLLRLFRGCSPDSLAGIPEVSPDGRFVRPLLAASRSQILEHARTRGIPWREDLSNQDESYARNRLRARWIPGLQEDFNPKLLRAVADLAEAQRRDAEWLESIIDKEAERRFTRQSAALQISPDGWDDLPEAMARRLVRRAFLEMGAGRDLSRTHLLRALAFLRDGRRSTTLELPGGLRMQRDASGFTLSRPART